MHELGTVFYVLDRVEELVKEHELEKVGSVTLEVGEVSGIIPMYLTDCWQWAIKKRIPALQEAELKIETLEAVSAAPPCRRRSSRSKRSRPSPTAKTAARPTPP